MIIAPPPMSLKSWWRMANQDTTLLRSLENEQIARLHLHGKTLDIGGGANFGYVELMRIDGKLESINIAPDVCPTFVADLNATLPIADGAYDNVICFNTIEHIYEERRILGELLRVLRRGGRFVITVPFLFRRHGKYGDFHRHTAEFWARTLCEAGLKSEDFTIQPLLCSPLSTALATLPWFRGGLRGRLAKVGVLFAAWLRGRRKGAAVVSCDDTDYALGFFIQGVKGISEEAGRP